MVYPLQNKRRLINRLVHPILPREIRLVRLHRFDQLPGAQQGRGKEDRAFTFFGHFVTLYIDLYLASRFAQIFRMWFIRASQSGFGSRGEIDKTSMDGMPGSGALLILSIREPIYLVDLTTVWALHCDLAVQVVIVTRERFGPDHTETVLAIRAPKRIVWHWELLHRIKLQVGKTRTTVYFFSHKSQNCLTVAGPCPA
jgi:hypothetical protein